MEKLPVRLEGPHDFGGNIAIVTSRPASGTKVCKVGSLIEVTFWAAASDEKYG